MSSMPTIVAAIVTALSSVTAITATSTDEYLPPITTTDTALIIPAFGQQSRFGVMDLSGATGYQTHRFRVELWVKHKGSNADLTQRARAVAAAAVRAFLDHPTLGGSVETIGWFDGVSSFDYAIDAEIADQLVAVGNASYLPVTIMLSVTDFSLP